VLLLPHWLGQLVLLHCSPASVADWHAGSCCFWVQALDPSAVGLYVPPGQMQLKKSLHALSKVLSCEAHLLWTQL
jgi:hypothetical protein